MNVQSKLILQILLMTSIVSFTNIAGKAAVNEIGPFAIVYFRWLIAWFTLWLILKYRGKSISLPKSDWPLLIGLMLCGVLLNQLFFMTGLKFTVPSHPSLFYATTSIWVLLIGTLTRSGDGFNQRMILAAILSVGGVALVLGKYLFQWQADMLKGDAILFLAVLMWASYTAFGKKAVQKYGALESTFIFLTIASLLYTPVGIWRLSMLPWDAISLKAWSGVLYMGIFTSGIGYILYYNVLRHLRPSQLGIMTSLQPPMTIFFSVIFGYEKIEWNLLAGTALVIGAVFTAQKSSISQSKIRST
ncbi:MAG TPA: DMT family transporter [Candidatus Marinimicrobia bacterium]|nr:DMT family transporter [Candidatus Neomarinimicrobiota bacterium]